MSRTLSGADIAVLLGLPLRGESLPISGPADLSACRPGSLVWMREATEAGLQIVRGRAPALVLCDEATAARIDGAAPVVVAANPRRSFAKILSSLYAPPRQTGLHPTAIIDPAARLAAGVSVGAYARIGPQVQIGEGSIIGSGVCLEGEVQIGARCVIKANSVLGGQGFAFEVDDDGAPIHFPHIGRVVLEDEVWIGACSTVERAGLGETRLGRGVKVDDLVQIGHNCTVGPATLIMAQVVLCGGAQIGASCWLAPGTLVKQKVRGGDGATLGLGSVVLRDVPPGSLVAGVPARALPKKDGG